MVFWCCCFAPAETAALPEQEVSSQHGPSNMQSLPVVFFLPTSTQVQFVAVRQQPQLRVLVGGHRQRWLPLMPPCSSSGGQHLCWHALREPSPPCACLACQLPLGLPLTKVYQQSSFCWHVQKSSIVCVHVCIPCVLTKSLVVCFTSQTMQQINLLTLASLHNLSDDTVLLPHATCSIKQCDCRLAVGRDLQSQNVPHVCPIKIFLIS